MKKQIVTLLGSRPEIGSLETPEELAEAVKALNEEEVYIDPKLIQTAKSLIASLNANQPGFRAEHLAGKNISLTNMTTSKPGITITDAKAEEDLIVDQINAGGQDPKVES